MPRLKPIAISLIHSISRYFHVIFVKINLRHQLYGHLPPITKTIQVRRTRHAGHCWRSRDELISDVHLWTPTHGRAKAGRPARTYIQQLCEDTGCCPEDLPEAMNDREKWRETVRDIRVTSTTWWWWWWWWWYLLNPSAGAGYDKRSVFKLILTGFNSESYFSQIGCHTRVIQVLLSNSRREKNRIHTISKSISIRSSRKGIFFFVKFRL